jgi:hypothetical protein
MTKIGPTGEFDREPINDMDRGSINVSIRRIVYAGKPCVEMEFGTGLDWLAAGPNDTMIMVHEFRTRITEWFGKMPYDASTLPITVTANIAKNVVESRLPVSAGILIANPEVFLAWADRLEEETRKLIKE